NEYRYRSRTFGLVVWPYCKIGGVSQPKPTKSKPGTKAQRSSFRSSVCAQIARSPNMARLHKPKCEQIEINVTGNRAIKETMTLRRQVDRPNSAASVQRGRTRR